MFKLTHKMPAQVLLWQAGNQGGRLGHRPAADMIHQGVYAVGCRVQRLRCTKPAAIAAAKVAVVYGTADDRGDHWC
jgi:hypothetical protein